MDAAPGQAGDAGPRRRSVPLGLDALPRHEHPGGHGAHHSGGGRDRLDPPLVQPDLHLRAAHEAPCQEGRTGLGGTQAEDLAHVRVGAARLAHQVVAVVPDHEQTRVAHRCVGRGAGPDHDVPVTPEHREPGAVALPGPQVSGQPGVPVRPEDGIEGSADSVDVTVVGHHDHGAPVGLRRGGGRFGQCGRPVECRRAAGQRGPGGRRRLTRGKAPEKGRPGRIVTPGRSHVRGRHFRFRRCRGRSRRCCGRERQRRRRSRGSRRRRHLGLDSSVSRWHRQPQHVGQCPAVVVGHRAAHRRQVGGQHDLVADDASQRGECSGVLRLGSALQDEPVVVATGQPDPDPDPRVDPGGVGLRHGILERPVQVSQRRVDHHPRHRQVVGHRPGGAAGPGPRCRHQGQLFARGRAVPLVHDTGLSHGTDTRVSRPTAAPRLC